MSPITDEAVEAMRRFAANARNWLDSRSDNAKPQWMVAQLPVLEAALEAALPHLSGVRVKPLEWSPEPPYWVARVFAGHYAIEVVQQGLVELRGNFVCKDFATFSEAKSAAQADYERRIMSALSSPAPEASSTALAIIEKLRAENYLIRNELDNLRDNLHEVETRAEAAEARLAEAVEVLRPFADVADHDIGTDESDSDIFRPMTNHNIAAKITVGDMRRAFNFLQSLGKEG